jgi:hypothetical protein
VEVVIVPTAHDAATLVADAIAAALDRRPAPVLGPSTGADAIAAALDRRPAPVLGPSTGSSPLPAYRLLVAAVGAGRLTFAHASAVLLDEYI